MKYRNDRYLSEEAVINKNLLTRKLGRMILYKSTITFIKQIRQIPYTVQVHVYTLSDTKNCVYSISLSNTKNKFRLMKVFIDGTGLKELVSPCYDFCAASKQMDLNLLKQASNFLFTGRYSSFNKVYFKKNKCHAGLPDIVSYIGFDQNIDSSINSKRLTAKKLLISKVIKVRNIYVVIQFFSSLAFDHIQIIVYMSQTCRYYHAKLLYNHIDQIMFMIDKKGDESFQINKARNFESKQKFYEAVISHNKDFFLKQLSISIEKAGANILNIRHLKLILQNNLANSLVVCNDVIYNIEINIGQFQPFYAANMILHLTENSSPNLYLKINNLHEKSCMDIKLSLHDLSKVIGLLKDSNVTIGVLYSLAHRITNNFIDFWNKINLTDHFNNRNLSSRFERFGLNHFSPILMPGYTNLLVQTTYPIFIGKQVFSIQPKRIYYIFLASKDTLQISVYNQTKRSTAVHFIRNEMLGNISNLVEHHLSMHLTKELSVRIFDVLKNRFVAMIISDK